MGNRQSRWSRLARMSWPELSTRTRQEIGKRVDWMRHRTGLGPVRAHSPEGVARRGNFFFTPADLPQRTQLLRQHLPKRCEEIVQEADAICRHQFRLLGYEPLDYGAVIDWHLDAVSGKRAPLKPWYQIPFLVFDQVGDHKVIWELNRHQHLVTLAKAWRLTGDARYAQEVVAQWRSWQATNPYPLGINWSSSLEAAFRGLSWLWMLSLLADCRDLPPSFEIEVGGGLELHARHIERYLSTYFSPNTHLLGEALALFFVGTLFAALPNAARWSEQGWRILAKQAERQVRGDGVYFEQALYYHVYALDFFLHARALADKNAVAIPPSLDRRINAMLDVVQTLSQAGPPEAFGDDDGGRLFDPRRNRGEHLTDPLALGALAYGRKDLMSRAVMTEEALWVFGEASLVLPRTGSTFRDRPESSALREGGLYVLSDGEAHGRLTIDAGPQGTGQSGHGHADALSVTLALQGRRCLIDSGTAQYVGPGNVRDWFRGTAAHNTLCVDGLDQAQPAGPFAWSEIPQVSVERWTRGPAFDYFSGSHNGYRRIAEPVVHRRTVFRTAGLWFVRDVVDGRGTHDFEVRWHMASHLRLEERGDAVIARSTQERSGEAAGGFAIVSTSESGWSREIASANVSPAYGRIENAPLVRFHAKVPTPTECVALLIAGADRASGVLSTMIGGHGLHAYRYQTDHATQDFVFAAADSPWDSDGWSSDAEFLYSHVQDGKLIHLVVVNGSFAKWQQLVVVQHHSRVECMQWSCAGHAVTASASGNAALKQVLRDELWCLHSVNR